MCRLCLITVCLKEALFFILDVSVPFVLLLRNLPAFRTKTNLFVRRVNCTFLSRESAWSAHWPETAFPPSARRDEHKDALIRVQWQLLCPRQRGNISSPGVMRSACRPAGTFHTGTREAHAVPASARLQHAPPVSHLNRTSW